MVKKLFKHEFLSYVRAMGIVYGILLTMAAATRIISLFESDTNAYHIILSFSNLTYIVSAAATIGFAFVIGIVRFYKNMFSAEGYLTHTLPVTAGQHILVKSVTAVSMNWLSAIVALLSVFIALPYEQVEETLLDILYIFGQLLAVDSTQSFWFGLEYFVLLVLSSFSSVMLYYACISLGQLSKKNRILAAVGVYFLYYIISQIVSTIVTIILTALASISVYLYDFLFWVGEHPTEVYHTVMWIIIFFQLVFAVAEYFVIRWVLTKKLNLE